MARVRWCLMCSVAFACADDTAVGDGSAGGSAGEGVTHGSNPDTAGTAEGGSASEDSGATTGGGDPFGSALEIPLGVTFTPVALALGDVDGDGNLDLIVTGTDASSAVRGATLRGDGAGGFAAAVDAGVAACSAFPVVGDVDGDARADLFFGTCEGEGVFFRGTEDASFAAIDVLAPWTDPPVRSSSFADYDGDGDCDLAIVSVGDASNELHLAIHGGATPPWPVNSQPIMVDANPGFDPDGLTAFAGDGDELADVLALDRDQALVAFTSEGTGFSPPVDVPLAIQPSRVAPIDLDQDGVDELVVASITDAAFQLVKRDADGNFLASSPAPSDALQPFDLAADDHGAWVAAIDDDAPQMAVLQPMLDGSFALSGTRELPSPAVRVLAGDLDSDQDDDLVAATFANGSVTVLLAGE